ncbi:hypothetical protein ACTVCO_06960 [Sanguibacter sp. A247]|uniref:hypothetical protein n=1 Tax=unclassified Sanguibacter TaxID=2645534 RepID=UPI003FD826E9
MTHLAIVESPLQVLGLAEAVLAGAEGPVTVVPRTATASATLRVLAPHLPANLTVHPSWLRPGTPGSSSLVLGDALSGAGQARLILHGRRSPVTLLDDGTATLLLIDALVGQGSLVRAQSPPSVPRRMLAAAARHALASRARAGLLTVRTCLPLDPHEVIALTREGVRVERHALERVRALDVAPAITDDVVVLGSALADDGLIAADAYEVWLTTTIRAAREQGSSVRYLAHRREPAARLARVAREGASTDAIPVPAELRLHGRGGVRRVVTLPTSVLLTIGPALVADGVDVDAQAVPASWWTPRASLATRAHLGMPLALFTRAAAAGAPRPGPAPAPPPSREVPAE